MQLEQIMQAVEDGKTVCWKNEGYTVVKDRLNQWLVVYWPNGYTVGLMDRSGRLMGLPEDYFVKEE